MFGCGVGDGACCRSENKAQVKVATSRFGHGGKNLINIFLKQIQLFKKEKILYFKDAWKVGKS